MPKNKDLKRVIRARMEKTGESYTAARAQVLAKQDRSAAGSDAAPAPPASTVTVGDYPALAGMSDAAVHKRTGRTWEEWVEVLDAYGAIDKPHRDIVAHLHEDHGIDGWWAQMTTVGYERIRGLREMSQRRDGSYDANKSKTFAVPIGRLYKAFATERARERWLPGIEITVRTSTRDKSVRLSWEDGTPVEAYFTAKGADKSSVQVQHRKLPSKDAVSDAKEYWGERLAALAEILGA